ncbi:MAG: zinc ribbon domain-containing protein [Gemmatimonadota bacterium]|nr:zinc ribbon domain-containing protein [Gemmatimonadota bacterium]
MPTYEYRCRACGHEFERFQKISDSPVRTCPSCKKRRVERLISSGGGLVFKGPGFYATDYRKGGGSASGEKEKTSSGEKSKTSSGDAGSDGGGKGESGGTSSAEKADA